MNRIALSFSCCVIGDVGENVGAQGLKYSGDEGRVENRSGLDGKGGV